MLALTVAVLVGQSGPYAEDVDGLVTKSKNLLVQLGMNGPFRLEQLSPPDPKYPAPNCIVFKDRNGHLVSLYFQGRSMMPFSVFCGEEGGDMLRFTAKRHSDPTLIRKLEHWIHLFAGSESVRLENVLVDKSKRGQATFGLLRNGYPFLNSANYILSFQADTGEFRAYRGLVRIPRVDGQPAKVDRWHALNLFANYFEREVAKPGKRVKGWDLSYKLLGGPIIGYYSNLTDAPCHLVWEIQYQLFGETGSFSKHTFSESAIVDAVTGRVLSPPPRVFQSSRTDFRLQK